MLDGDLKYSPFIDHNGNIYIVQIKGEGYESRSNLISINTNGKQNWIYDSNPGEPVITSYGKIYIDAYSFLKVFDYNGNLKECYNIFNKGDLLSDEKSKPYLFNPDKRNQVLYRIYDTSSAKSDLNVYDEVLFKDLDPTQQAILALEKIKEIALDFSSFTIQDSLLKKQINNYIHLIENNQIDIRYITKKNEQCHERELSYHELIEEKPIIYIRPINYIIISGSVQSELITSALTLFYEMARVEFNNIYSNLKDEVNIEYFELMEEFMCSVYIVDLIGLNNLRELIENISGKIKNHRINMVHLRHWKQIAQIYSQRGIFETGEQIYFTYYIQDYPPTDNKSWDKILNNFNNLTMNYTKNKTEDISIGRAISILTKIHRPDEWRKLRQYYDQQNKILYRDYGITYYSTTEKYFKLKDSFTQIIKNDSTQNEILEGRMFFHINDEGEMEVSDIQKYYITKESISVKFKDRNTLDFMTARDTATNKKVRVIHAYTTDGLNVIIDLYSESVFILN